MVTREVRILGKGELTNCPKVVIGISPSLQHNLQRYCLREEEGNFSLALCNAGCDALWQDVLRRPATSVRCQPSAPHAGQLPLFARKERHGAITRGKQTRNECTGLREENAGREAMSRLHQYSLSNKRRKYRRHAHRVVSSPERCSGFRIYERQPRPLSGNPRQNGYG